MGESDNVTQVRGRFCPICNKPATLGQRPFCSARCRDLDLSHWLKGGYRMATEEPMGEADSEPEAEQE